MFSYRLAWPNSRYKFSNLSDCVTVKETSIYQSDGKSTLAMVVDWKVKMSNISSIDP